MIETLPPLPLPPTRLRTVLVVDPSPAMRSVICMILSEHGYEVKSSGHALSALAALRQGFITGPVLVVLADDWSTPPLSPPAVPRSLDGLGMLRLLKQWDLPLQVIMLLSEPGVRVSLEYRLAGACACLAKPFRVQHLLHLIQVYGRV